MVEYIGYLASVFVAFSLIVNGVLKFRIINSIGCITFIVYGLIIGAMPIAVANGTLLLINFYQLYKLYHSKEEFKAFEVEENNPLKNNFIEANKKDIEAIFPKFNYSINLKNSVRLVVLRNEIIAGIFIATIDNEGIATIEIDYTIKQFRDFKVGRFIFENQKAFLKSKHIKKLVYKEINHKQHLQFVLKMGFKQQDVNGDLLWSKNLI